jgi:hypothetical protein
MFCSYLCFLSSNMLTTPTTIAMNTTAIMAKSAVVNTEISDAPRAVDVGVGADDDPAETAVVSLSSSMIRRLQILQ